MKSCHCVTPVGESPKIGMGFYYTDSFSLQPPGYPCSQTVSALNETKSNINIHLNIHLTLGVPWPPAVLFFITLFYPTMRSHTFNISRTLWLYSLCLFHNSFLNRWPGPQPGKMSPTILTFGKIYKYICICSHLDLLSQKNLMLSRNNPKSSLSSRYCWLLWLNTICNTPSSFTHQNAEHTTMPQLCQIFSDGLRIFPDDLLDPPPSTSKAFP